MLQSALASLRVTSSALSSRSLRYDLHTVCGLYMYGILPEVCSTSSSKFDSYVDSPGDESQILTTTARLVPREVSCISVDMSRNTPRSQIAHLQQPDAQETHKLPRHVWRNRVPIQTTALCGIYPDYVATESVGTFAREKCSHILLAVLQQIRACSKVR